MRRKRPTLIRRLRIEAAGQSIDSDELRSWGALFASTEWQRYLSAPHEARAFADRPPRLELFKSTVFLLLAYAAESLSDLLDDLPEDLPSDMAQQLGELDARVMAIVDEYIGWGSRFTRLAPEIRQAVIRSMESEIRWLEHFEAAHQAT